MDFLKHRNLLVFLALSAICIAGVVFVLDRNKYAINENFLQSSTASVPQDSVGSINVEKPKLANPPQIVRAVYVTENSASSGAYLSYLKNLFATTEINAVVVNIKSNEGYVSYNSEVEDVRRYNLYNEKIKDIDSLIKFFHDQNIYVIGRIVLFQDPLYAKARPELAVYDISKSSPENKVIWQDSGGMIWLDPASKDVWNYNISLAKNAFLHGFDEINFDYIRFPSDGNLENAGFPVWDGKTFAYSVINGFFEYARQELSKNKISVDLFGQTTTDKGDMGIGQLIENAFANFDYVSPMVYPSHYASGFLGFQNPAEHPYEIVKYSMLFALLKQKMVLNNGNAFLGKIRPWLQDFDMGADYNSEMVKLEIKATQEALGDEYNGFMLWNPNNIYTKEALIKSQ